MPRPLRTFRRGAFQGPRDRHALLESAVAAPQASWGGKSPYADVIEVAAAYLFYLCRNHPFVDGNKRVALGACLVFLKLNGVETPPDGPQWSGIWILDVAACRIDREEATNRLSRHPDCSVRVKMRGLLQAAFFCCRRLFH